MAADRVTTISPATRWQRYCAALHYSSGYLVADLLAAWSAAAAQPGNLIIMVCYSSGYF